MKDFVFIHIPRTAGTSIFSRLEYFPKHFKNMGNDFQGHTYSTTALRILGQDVWNSCFKFSFVRNPWERVASMWGCSYDLLLQPTLQEFWDMNLAQHTFFEETKIPGSEPLWDLRNQTDWLTEPVDFVGRHENIAHDWEYICKQLDIRHIPLPRLHLTKWSEENYHYNAYSQDLMKAVGKHFQKDIEHYGYQF